MPDPTLIVDLNADVKPFIGINTSDTSKDTLLQFYIDGATVWAEYVSDIVLPKTYTGEVHSGGRPKIFLFNRPILEVVEVVEYVGVVAYPLMQAELGSGVNDPYSFSIDNPDLGCITRRWNMIAGNFMGGRDNITVTYKAGRAVVPGDIKLSVLMDIQGLFVGTQMGGRPAVGSASPDFDYSSGPSVPLSMFPRLQSMVAPSARVPGIA